MSHVIINHLSEKYVKCAFRKNTIEGFWSQLERTIKETHIHVSKRHLQKYIHEAVFRYEYKNKLDTMFETILKNVV